MGKAPSALAFLEVRWGGVGAPMWRRSSGDVGTTGSI